MIKIENPQIVGLEPATRGMRNPMNSWDKSDSGYGCKYCEECVFPIAHDPACDGYHIGKRDRALMEKLAAAGSSDRKFMRMLVVYVDVTAPLYWWKEYETYKIGTVSNSCSTMHKLTEKEFEWGDFSTDHLDFHNGVLLFHYIENLNEYRKIYINGGEVRQPDETTSSHPPKDKDIWWQLIQMLPSSYNQRRTLMLNYEVLRNIYHARRNHKLDEWREFCKWIETLPYAAELITGEVAGLINGEG